MHSVFCYFLHLQAHDGEPLGDLNVFKREGSKVQDDSWLYNEPSSLDGFVRKWTLSESVFKDRPREADSKSWYVCLVSHVAIPFNVYAARYHLLKLQV